MTWEGMQQWLNIILPPFIACPIFFLKSVDTRHIYKYIYRHTYIHMPSSYGSSGLWCRVETTDMKGLKKIEDHWTNWHKRIKENEEERMVITFLELSLFCQFESWLNLQFYNSLHELMGFHICIVLWTSCSQMLYYMVPLKTGVG